MDDQSTYPHHMSTGFVSKGVDMGASAPACQSDNGKLHAACNAVVVLSGTAAIYVFNGPSYPPMIMIPFMSVSRFSDFSSISQHFPMRKTCSWTLAVVRPWYEVCFFYVFARMVDATLMMGVLGWGGGDGNVP